MVGSSIELQVDVTEAAGLGERLHTAVTVVAPDAADLVEPPVICFAWPGGGYSRRYFTFDMPGATGGGEAGWHAARGWIFVACDHLYVGDSGSPTDPAALTYENLAAANRATVDGVLALLAAGELGDLPPIADPVTLGIGQSMGGCLLVVQQGQHATFDGIGVLGYSGSHTVLWYPPGITPASVPYRLRGSKAVTVRAVDEVRAVHHAAPDGELPPTAPGFHYDDVPRDVVIADMVDYPTRQGKVPPWGSATIPPCATTMLTPGAVAPEAASITVPVFLGVGERDVCPDPWSEPKAYKRATDITVYVCPRMSHMHNFAGTRERFWSRLHAWGRGVATTSA